MIVQFRCACGQKLKAQDKAAGNRGRCPKCGVWLVIPRSSSFTTVAEVAGQATVEPEAAAKPLHEREPALSAPPKGRVVLADSDMFHRANHATMLRDRGYLVLETTETHATVELIRKERPDAAIVDLEFDTGSGFRVVAQILSPTMSKNRDVWHMPILMTATVWSGRDKQYAISRGVKYCFLKPLEPAQFCRRLENVIRTYRSH